MIPRRFLTILVFSLPVLVLSFAILMGAAGLTDALQDSVGARCLRWGAVLVLLVLVADVLLLVGLLGMKALQDEEPRDSELPPEE